MLIKRQVVDQLVDHFGDNIMVISSPRVSSIVVFRNRDPTLLKLVPSDDDSDLDMSTIPIESFCLDKTKQSHTKSRQNNFHSVHAKPCRIYEQS